MAPFDDPGSPAGSQAREAGVVDVVVAELAGMVARLGALAGPDIAGSDAARIDRIALLERVKAAAGAAQGEEIVRFARSQVASQEQLVGLDPRAVGRGIADQGPTGARSWVATRGGAGSTGGSPT